MRGNEGEGEERRASRRRATTRHTTAEEIPLVSGKHTQNNQTKQAHAVGGGSGGGVKCKKS